MKYTEKGIEIINNVSKEYLRLCSDWIDKIKVIKDAIIEDLKKERKSNEI